MKSIPERSGKFVRPSSGLTEPRCAVTVAQHPFASNQRVPASGGAMTGAGRCETGGGGDGHRDVGRDETADLAGREPHLDPVDDLVGHTRVVREGGVHPPDPLLPRAEDRTRPGRPADRRDLEVGRGLMDGQRVEHPRAAVVVECLDRDDGGGVAAEVHQQQLVRQVNAPVGPPDGHRGEARRDRHRGDLVR
jgi:hypothetical protein